MDFEYSDRSKALVEKLTKFMDEVIYPAEPVYYEEQDWSGERWSGGCYLAHMPPGVLTQFGRALRAPIGRIHWACTEGATVSHGTIDGAIRSGTRAAKEILDAA